MEVGDLEIRMIDEYSFKIGKEDAIEKTKEFLKSAIPIHEHHDIIEEYVKYMEE